MNAIRIPRKLDSDTLHLPELKPLIGRTVEITVEEQVPAIRDEFWAEAGRSPETPEAFEAQKQIFRVWRTDQRFEPYWPTIDAFVSQNFEAFRKKVVAFEALTNLEDYDYDALRDMDACDMERARRLMQ